MVCKWEIEDHKDVEAQNGQERNIIIFQKEVSLCYMWKPAVNFYSCLLDLSSVFFSRFWTAAVPIVIMLLRALSLSFM